LGFLAKDNMNKIYSLGYRNCSFTEFALFVKNGADVVDIRFCPHTKLPFWDQKYLQERFLSQYHHIKELGNINFSNKQPIKIFDLETGLGKLSKIVSSAKMCILFCACEEYDKCHRKVVVEAFLAKNPFFVFEELFSNQ
jgi:uncharacterized protein (DUF488 family)